MPGNYWDREPAGSRREGRVDLRLPGLSLELATARGVFGAQRIDRGTMVLLRNAPPPAPATGSLDLGTGYGPIAVTMARREPRSGMVAIDVNSPALDLTSANACSAGAANVFALRPEEVPPALRFDTLYSNPPIKIGKDELRQLLRTWLGRLVDGGRALLVVKQAMGADSLRTWLNDGGYPTDRVLSRRGYRLLRVRDPKPALRPGLTADELAVLNRDTGTAWSPLGRLAGGWSDAVHLVRHGDTEAVVKIKEGEWWGGQLSRAVTVVDALRANGYPAPVILGIGRFAEDRHYLLTEYIPGERPGRLSPANLDELLAAIETQAQVHPPEIRDWSAMTTLFLNGGIADFEFHPTVLDRARRALGLCSRPVPALPTGDFVHGDLTTRNVLARNGRLAGIIDFEGFGRGSRAIDLVNLLQDVAGRPELADRVARRAIEAGGADTFLACVAHRVLAGLSWTTERPHLLPGTIRRVDLLLAVVDRLS